MNYLEQFMSSVNETFLTQAEAESYILKDSFHTFVRQELKKLYKYTAEKYGDMIGSPKYHTQHGSVDIRNPYGSYDDELTAQEPTILPDESETDL